MTRAMPIQARDIDHLTLTLADPAKAALQLEQLGFTLTPEDADPRAICFQPADDEVPNYFEITEGEFEGATLAVNVAETTGEARTQRWSNEDDIEVEAELVVGEGGGPLPWLPVQQKTPEAFSDPEWIVHPNGALGFIAVHAVADDPAATMKALAKAWKAEGEEIFEGCSVVKTGAVELLIWTPAAYQNEYKDIEVMAPDQRPTVVGIGIAVERARPLQALLRANNVPFAVGEGDRILVAPEQAGGLMIEFLPQN
jgi:4-hydroxyphenylpyruvate dioxygenase-like putative hemolysin